MISQLTISALKSERYLQHSKFGKSPLATDVEAVAIMGEEFGEICRAICQGKEHYEIEKEVIHLAAVCIAYLDGDLHFDNQK